MSRKHFMLAAFAVLGLACSDVTPPTPPGLRPGSEGALTPGANPAIPTEQLARFVARGLSDPEFRSYVHSALEASPYAEHKLHFQRLLTAGGGRAVQAIARANGTAESVVLGEVARVGALEIYLPVPAHRAAWTGGLDVLVATAETDREPPVAFDPLGRRRVLDPETPPQAPVIALVPVETDFDAGPARQECIICDDGGGTGGGDPPPPPAPAPGLYMSAASFVDDFEGWLKGNPEFEVHILGQKGQTDSLTDYQCAGEHAGWPYAFNQDSRSWAGSVLLFSARQIADYRLLHPGQNVRVFFVEDDDTPCVIKAGRDLFKEVISSVDEAYKGFTAGRDTTDLVGPRFRNAPALQKVWDAIAAWIKSNDELVGNAVEDEIARTYREGYNWIVKGKDNVTNGWVKLEMR